MAKGNRTPTDHHTAAHAERPIELVHIDIAGPFLASLGGSRYVLIFVDSVSRLQRPYGTRDKSAAAILTWEFHKLSGVTTEQSTRTIYLSNTATTSGSDASSRRLIRLTKWSRGEGTPQGLQCRTRGTSGSLEHLSGHPFGRSQELYERGGN